MTKEMNISRLARLQAEKIPMIAQVEKWRGTITARHHNERRVRNANPYKKENSTNFSVAQFHIRNEDGRMLILYTQSSQPMGNQFLLNKTHSP